MSLSFLLMFKNHFPVYNIRASVLFTCACLCGKLRAVYHEATLTTHRVEETSSRQLSYTTFTQTIGICCLCKNSEAPHGIFHPISNLQVFPCKATHLNIAHSLIYIDILRPDFKVNRNQLTTTVSSWRRLWHDLKGRQLKGLLWSGRLPVRQRWQVQQESRRSSSV